MKKDKKFYLVCSLTIGDGCLCQRRKSKKAELSIAHHIKHKDYINYKKRILIDAGLKVKSCDKKHFPNAQYVVYTNSNYLCYCVRNMVYGDKIGQTYQRKFTSRMKQNLDEWSLAILWMDDGCLSFQKRKQKDGTIYYYKVGKISTNAYGKKGSEEILLWLKKFGIVGYLGKDNRFSEDMKYFIAFSRDNVNKLIEVVKPIVKKVPSMAYKIRD